MRRPEFRAAPISAVAARSNPGGRAAQTRLNSGLAVALMLVVALAPLPLGSNRPLFWATSAAVVCAIGLWHTLSLLRIGGELRFSVRNLGTAAVLQTIFSIFLVVQQLPIGALVPIVFEGSASAPFRSQTLSLTPGSTWLMLLRMVGYAAFFYLMTQVSMNAARAKTLLWALFSIVVAYAVLGLFMLTQAGDTLLLIPKWAYQGSATATFVNRNSYATFLAMGMAMGGALLLATILSSRSPTERVYRSLLLIVSLAVVAAALVASNSRMGTTAGFAGFGVVAVLGGIKMRMRWIGWALLLGLLLAAVVVVLSVFGTGVLERVIDVEGSAEGRFGLYAQVWQMILMRPWTGYGGGSFELAYPLFHALPVDPEHIWDRAHSTYLALWFELGLVFGSIPLLVLLSLLVVAIRAFLQSEDNWAVGLGAIGAVVVGALHSTLDFSLEIQANAYLLIAVLGLAAGRDSGVRGSRAGISSRTI